MAKYTEYCGWTLARAHVKSGEAAIISGYLGDSNKFDEAIASFAVNYSDQNERDYRAF
jgi:NAD(P)H-dependent flavin oxidoreductase YrpB (nitropropane dioxygenase family)